MFCGLIIKPGQKVKLDSTEGDILHLSNACLSEPKDNGRVYVQAIDNGVAYTICSLQKGTVEHTNLDLFFSTSAEIELSVIGKNEVHISGFYEPEMEEDDFDDEDALMDMSDEEDEDELELEEEAKANNVKKSVKRKLSNKPEESTDEEIEDEEINSDEADDLDLDELIQGEDDEENDDDDDDDDEDDEDDDDDLEDEDDDEEEEEEEEVAKAPSTKNKNKQSGSAVVQKTKPVTSQPPSKKSRVEAKSQSKPDQIYEESIVDFLKKNGRSNMAMIGNKIKRPEGVSKKLGSFIAERTNLFKVENNMISLVK